MCGHEFRVVTPLPPEESFKYQEQIAAFHRTHRGHDGYTYQSIPIIPDVTAATFRNGNGHQSKNGGPGEPKPICLVSLHFCNECGVALAANCTTSKVWNSESLNGSVT